MPSREKNPSKKDSIQLYIVGIGASAGGFEALEQFFQNIPVNTGIAFVVIQHLDPRHVGIMPELLQRATPLKVQQAVDQVIVRADQVYVIPPNKSMKIINGRIHLFEPIESHGLRLPIDIFFLSLANEKLEKSVGIILSGMGSDGSLGVKAIKEKNGLVLIQDPANAKFDGMPSSAIEAVDADVIASAEDLPDRLIHILNLFPHGKSNSEVDIKIKSNIDKIIGIIRDQTGHDFSLYKKTTLFRRIERRKSAHQIEKIQNYVQLLQENATEVEILFNEILIGVTGFFRDPEVWKSLKENILPPFLNNLPDRFVVRCWVAGCSTGEEAYSLAITFKEAMDKMKKRKNISFQIFATDIDAEAIEKARRGYYPKSITTDISVERLNRFFTEKGEGYLINTSIRDMVVFAPQNVIKDPPFTKLNILLCRNMLIYMESELQRKLISLFNSSLYPNGILLLGSAETIGSQDDRFDELDGKHKIYKRSAAFFPHEFIDFPSSFRKIETTVSEKMETPKVVENIQTLTDQILLQRFAPPSVLVNNKGDIIYITGRTGKYLEPVAGKANWNIYAMARDGIRNELPGGFRKAMRSYEPVILRNMKMDNNNNSQYVDVTIQRLDNPEPLRGMLIVVFSEVPIIVTHKLSKSQTNNKVNEDQAKLELELQRSYEEIQSVREEMQTSQEELKSTNEELQSTNEELQSSNEELTTSKEEMQSLNEELQTVNIELQSKVNDLLMVNDDMKNLLNSTEIATLFLDKDLNIRRFTDSVTNIFKIRNSDIGRPFTDLVSSLHYPEIEIHAKNVLKTLITLETAITTNDKRWFSIRIMPYRTLDDRIDGLVITFNDITLSKKLEIELKEANNGLHNDEKS